MSVVSGTERAEFPTNTDMFWTIFLQFPALSWMDVARKRSAMRIIQEVANSGTGCGTDFSNYRDFCVANVETYEIAEYRES